MANHTETIRVGDTVTANVLGNLLKGEVTGFGWHKGKRVLDIKPNRFVYFNQITEVSRFDRQRVYRRQDIEQHPAVESVTLEIEDDIKYYYIKLKAGWSIGERDYTIGYSAASAMSKLFLAINSNPQQK